MLYRYVKENFDFLMEAASGFDRDTLVAIFDHGHLNLMFKGFQTTEAEF